MNFIKEVKIIPKYNIEYFELQIIGFLLSTFHSLYLDINTRLLLQTPQKLKTSTSNCISHVWKEHEYRLENTMKFHRKSMFLLHITPVQVEDLMFQTVWTPSSKTAKQVNYLS